VDCDESGFSLQRSFTMSPPSADIEDLLTMLKCPFCHFENEDGALFCEQCKSDLAGAEPAAPPAATPATPAMDIPLAVETVQDVPGPSSYFEGLADDAAPFAPITPIDSTATPMAAPMAEFVAPETPECPAPVPELAPQEPAAAASAATEATIAEPAAITMPASAIPAPGSLAPAADAGTLAPDAQPRLLVLRGQKRNVEYPIYDGHNFIGRADEKPVDIDLEDQEPPDRIWCSRQHALISFEEQHLTIEDLNSANGTFVNRTRIYPGQKRPLSVNDVIQIGNVQLKVIV
jgi:hypothetical protein